MIYVGRMQTDASLNGVALQINLGSLKSRSFGLQAPDRSGGLRLQLDSRLHRTHACTWASSSILLLQARSAARSRRCDGSLARFRRN